MELPKFTPVVQFATASFALVVGGYSAGDKLGWFPNPILEWSPEHFMIPPAQIGQPVTATVARIKKRDDCSVEAFIPNVRDAAGMIHDAVPSNSKFTGPASNQAEKFTYQLRISDKEPIAPGKATLTAIVKYKCPEGERVVTYPNHPNLTFMLERS